MENQLCGSQDAEIKIEAKSSVLLLNLFCKGYIQAIPVELASVCVKF